MYPSREPALGGHVPSSHPLSSLQSPQSAASNSRRINERHSRSRLSWKEWGKECGLGANLGNTVTSVIEQDAPVGLARPFVPQGMPGHGPGPGMMGRRTRPGVSGRPPQQDTEIWQLKSVTQMNKNKNTATTHSSTTPLSLPPNHPCPQQILGGQHSQVQIKKNRSLPLRHHCYPTRMFSEGLTSACITQLGLQS